MDRPFSFKSLTIFTAAWLALFAVIPNTSSAIGLGGYFEFLRAEGSIDPGTSLIDDLDYDTDKFGVGFALDTNLARNRLFNYRLTVGYQHSSRDFDAFTFAGTTYDLGDVDADGFNINNVFGFGVWRGRHHRLWLGPAIRLGVDVFDTGISDLDIVDVSVGGGAVIGLNLHAGRRFSMSLSAGYQYLYVAEIISIDTQAFDETEGFDANEHLISANLTIFFRSPSDLFQ